MSWFFRLICFPTICCDGKKWREKKRARKTEKSKRNNQSTRTHLNAAFRPKYLFTIFFLFLVNVYLCQFLSMFMRRTIIIVVLGGSALAVDKRFGSCRKRSIQITQKHMNNMEKWIVALLFRCTSLSLCVRVRIKFRLDSINIGKRFQLNRDRKYRWNMSGDTHLSKT